MATIKELLSTIIDKINDNKNKIDNIKGVPEAFDSITMTNGTDTANLTMSAEKELLFDGEAVGGGVTRLYVSWVGENGYIYKDAALTEKVTKEEFMKMGDSLVFVDQYGWSVYPSVVIKDGDTDYSDVLCLYSNGPDMEVAKLVNFYTAEYGGR